MADVFRVLVMGCDFYLSRCSSHLEKSWGDLSLGPGCLWSVIPSLGPGGPQRTALALFLVDKLRASYRIVLLLLSIGGFKNLS